MGDEELEKLRARIDEIDEQLLQLFNQRARCAVEVAEVKRALNQGEEDINFFRPDREAQVIKRLKSLNQGPLSDEEIGRLIREVMSACLALEQPLKIAYLGPEGTFTQSAALKHFGHSVSTVPMSSIPDVFSSVKSGHADYGLVPVENSTEGVISHTLDMFIDSALKVCGEVEIRIHHHLAMRSPDTAAIRHIYSHQQSFAQCRRWLDQNFPGIERIPVSSSDGWRVSRMTRRRSAAYRRSKFLNSRSAMKISRTWRTIRHDSSSSATRTSTPVETIRPRCWCRHATCRARCSACCNRWPITASA